MSVKTKHLIRVICFLLIFALLFLGAQRILQSKWDTFGTNGDKYIVQQFNSLKKNSVELAIMGSSQAVQGVSSMRFLEAHQISAFSTAGAIQPTDCMYYYTKQLLKKQQLKAVLIDTSMLFEEPLERGFRRVSDFIPFSADKMELILNYSRYNLANKGSGSAVRKFWSYMFPIMQFHDRWEELGKSDFTDEGASPFVFRGNTSLFKRVPQDLEKILVDDKEADPDLKYDDYELTYFRKTLDALQKAGVKTVLFKTPKTSWTRAHYEGAQAIADEYGLDYIDFNLREYYEAAGIDGATDFSDRDHLNYHGSFKLTDYLAEYLKAQVSFTPAVPDAAEQKRLEVFHRYNIAADLIMTNDISELIASADQEGFELLVQIDAGSELPEALRAALSDAGLHVDTAGADGQNYIARVSGGTLVHEQQSGGMIT